MGLTEFGHFALISAFVLSLIQSVVPLCGAARRDMRRPMSLDTLPLFFASLCLVGAAHDSALQARKRARARKQVSACVGA